MPVPKHLAVSLTCHAWNADGTQCAVCPNSNEVHIYSVKGENWEKIATLKEHDLVVTSIDWGHKTNRIVTCSQDRNAFVWTLEGNTWQPVLVILRVNRAATCVKWSPNEEKFAVATGSKVVSVCFYEDDHSWWVSKHIKNHKSTITSVSWHPDNVLLATGSTDFTVRVFSAFVRDVDKRAQSALFGGKLPFGEKLWEGKVTGWAHSVAWSPDGKTLAYAAHDGGVSFAYFSGPDDVTVSQIRGTSLPFRSIAFIDAGRLVAGGHDMNPTIFSAAGPGNWQQSKQLDTGSGSTASPAKSGGNAAFKMFANKVDRGEETSDARLATSHQNSIIGVYVGNGFVSTCGVDGNICVWKP